MKEINNYLDEEIIWKRAKDPRFPFSASYDGQTLILRLNDFPAEHLYTLIAEGGEADFDDWPNNWTRSADSATISVKKRKTPHSQIAKPLAKVNVTKRRMVKTGYILTKQKSSRVVTNGTSKAVKAKEKRVRSE